MGTNYYLFTQDKNWKNKYFPEIDEVELVDEPDFGYQIHLNKCSFGWRTLFQWHPHAYKSITEMKKFLCDNHEKYTIYDEYNEQYDLNSYESKVLERDTRLLNDREPCTWGYDKLFGGYGIIPVKSEVLPKEVIYTPFDHEEYEAFHNKYSDIHTISRYHHDFEGYNFLEGDFS